MTWKPDYVTVSDLKSYLRISDATDDIELLLAVSSASRAIDEATNRQFGVTASTEARYYTACWDRRIRRWTVEIDDVQTTSGLVITVDQESGPYAITDYTLTPRNAAAEGVPWTSFIVNPDSTYKPSSKQFDVSVTATFGWTSVPEAIEQACLLQASRFHARRTSPFGVAGSPEFGSELRLLDRLDADVAVIVGPYKRWWAVG